MTSDEVTNRLLAAGFRIRPAKKGPMPQPIAIPGMSEAVQHRDCCDECDSAREYAVQHGWQPDGS